MNWSFIEYFLFSVSSLDFNQSASFLIKINHNMYSMVFGYQSLLKQHITMFHNGSKSIQMEKDKSFMCDICSKIFFCKSNLKVHKATQHDKILQFSCEICDKYFGQKIHLKRHNTNHHEEKQVCEKTEPKKIRLENSEWRKIEKKAKWDKNGKPKGKTAKCDICFKTYFNVPTLKRHKTTQHNKIVEFSCEICDKQFGQKAKLKRHNSTVHDKISKFTCEICDKSFRHDASLKRHKVILHDKILQFSCEICAKHFGQKVQLDYHNNLHHNQIHEPKPIQIEKCEKLCEKMFSNSEDFCNHIRNDHLVTDYQGIGSFLAKNYICKLEAL